MYRGDKLSQTHYGVHRGHNKLFAIRSKVFLQIGQLRNRSVRNFYNYLDSCLKPEAAGENSGTFQFQARQNANTVHYRSSMKNLLRGAIVVSCGAKPVLI